ncbi:MAG: SH3 domain-containing protein [Deltaproteobacteria bacterium]
MLTTTKRSGRAAVLLACGLAGCAPGTVESDGSRDGAEAGDTRTVDSGTDPRDPDAGLDADIDAEFTPDLLPDGDDAASDATVTPMHIGGQARVTAGALNLRSGPGTTNAILTSMPCGTTVDIVGGPMTGWWNIRYLTDTGWSSGAYLVDPSAFDPAVCMTAPSDAGTTSDGGPLAPEIGSIFQRARLGVGYSYYWGHGSWRDDDTLHGSCSGSCPGCTHTGIYGADCSGFVAKVWQVPSASPLTTDRHPYSTYDFYNASYHWTRVARTAMQPGDAMVYNANGAGHILLFESGSDPWGSIWTYEARGCATGVVHNLRAVASTYVAIRREGL